MTLKALFSPKKKLCSDETIEEFGPRLLRFYRHLGADSKTSEDLTQELFLRLLRSNASYEERGQRKSYLFRMAYRIWIDETRLKRPKPVEGELPGSWNILADITESPFQALSRVESEERLQKALQQIPEEQKLVFELGVIQELRYREISTFLGIPIGTVKSRMFAAVRRLKTILSTSENSHELLQ